MVERDSQQGEKHSARHEEQQPDSAGLVGISDGKGYGGVKPGSYKTSLDPKHQAATLAVRTQEFVDTEMQRRQDKTSEQLIMPTAVKLEHALSLRGQTLSTDLSFQEAPPEMTESIHKWRCAGRKGPSNMGPRGRGGQSPRLTSFSKREGFSFSIDTFRDGSGSIDGLGSMSETGRNCDTFISASLIESTKDVVPPPKTPAVGSTSRASTHAPSDSRLSSSQGPRKLTSASATPSWGTPSVPSTAQGRRPRQSTAPGGQRPGVLPPLSDTIGAPPHSAPAQSTGSGGEKRSSSEKAKPRRRPSVADAIWWPEGTPWHQSTLGGSCPGPHWEGSSIAPMGATRDLGFTVPPTPPVLTQRGALVLSVDCIDPLMITSAATYCPEDAMSNASGEFGDFGDPWGSTHRHSLSTETVPRRSLVMDGQELDTWDSVFATEVSKGDSMTDPLNASRDSLEGYLSSQRMRVEGVRGHGRTSSSSPRRLMENASPRNDPSLPTGVPAGPPDREQLDELTRIFGVFDSVNDPLSRGSEALAPMPSMEQSTMVSEDSVWDQMRSIMSSIDDVKGGISRELREEMSLFTEGDAHAAFGTTSQVTPPGSAERPLTKTVVRPPRPRLRAKDPFRPKPPPSSEGAAIDNLAISQSTFSSQAPTLQVHSINKYLAKDAGRCDSRPKDPRKRGPLKAFPRKASQVKASASAPAVDDDA